LIKLIYTATQIISANIPSQQTNIATIQTSNGTSYLWQGNWACLFYRFREEKNRREEKKEKIMEERELLAVW
jgi:hypothetical protein